MKRKTSSNKTEGKRNYSDTPRENEEHKGKFSKPTFYSTAKRERTSEPPGGKKSTSDRSYTPREVGSSSRPEGRRDFSDSPRQSEDRRGKFSKPSCGSSNRREGFSDRPYTPREDRSSSRPEGRRDFSDTPRQSEDRRGKFSKPSFGSSDRRERPSNRPDAENRERSDRPFTPRDERPGSRFTERTEEKRGFSSSRPSEERRGKFSKPSFGSNDRRERSSDRPYESREEKPHQKSFDSSEGRRVFSDSPRQSEDSRDKFANKSSYKKAGSKSTSADLPFIPGMPKVHNPHKIVESKPAPVFSDEVRLNKYIANAGISSRRKADELISEGLVQVNGVVVQEMGFKVKPEDIVTYEGKKVINENKFYILLNKPKDFITTTSDERGRKTVMDLIKTATKGARVYPIGRLDRNTTGLLLFTNDGELAQHLSHPSTNVVKVYQAELDKPIKKEDLQTIRDGVELEDGFAQVDEIDITTPQVDPRFVGIAIHSGKNRIVRRIFEHVGYDVKVLDRVSYAGLTKKDLPRGKWRYITEKELVYLKYLTAGGVRR
ncbi:MAG TPA: pseudouridine synthase [Chitinophagales bacterium]|nr:pseudouridine synthase [Chitinophagales bacterium]